MSLVVVPAAVPVIPTQAGIQWGSRLRGNDGVVIPAQAGIQFRVHRGWRGAVHAYMDRQYYVYILASGTYGTLYIGVTNDLVRRIWEHRNDVVKGFSRDYGVHRLVWYEVHGSPYEAITREKQIKKWNRDWKVNLIQRFNPDWDDLFDKIVQ